MNEITTRPPWLDWAPAGTPAVHVWLCGRCSTELAVGSDYHYCEVCGARYDTETGGYLGGSGPATQN